ncbi:hypothetical protein [Oryza sativa Japonica Group]|uniref:Uncharacterized protein n=1 Tax=Oryza sativa subsp. japonica TaxID=39947 RepID=Q657N0_ORYSJ|nr:hypothetical protein [Oryza sativa Japonica Group]
MAMAMVVVSTADGKEEGDGETESSPSQVAWLRRSDNGEEAMQLGGVEKASSAL